MRPADKLQVKPAKSLLDSPDPSKGAQYLHRPRQPGPIKRARQRQSAALDQSTALIATIAIYCRQSGKAHNIKPLIETSTFFYKHLRTMAHSWKYSILNTYPKTTELVHSYLYRPQILFSRSILVRWGGYTCDVHLGRWQSFCKPSACYDWYFPECEFQIVHSGSLKRCPLNWAQQQITLNTKNISGRPTKLPHYVTNADTTKTTQ